MSCPVLAGSTTIVTLKAVNICAAVVAIGTASLMAGGKRKLGQLWLLAAGLRMLSELTFAKRIVARRYSGNGTPTGMFPSNSKRERPGIGSFIRVYICFKGLRRTIGFASTTHARISRSNFFEPWLEAANLLPISMRSVR